MLIIKTVSDYSLLISDNIHWFHLREREKKNRHHSVCFFLKGLCLCFYRARDIDSRRCDAKINTRNDFRRRRGLPLHLPFIFPLNYLRALRDWPTNPVRLNNLPIIRGPLCFIRRVSNKSHCVFRRAASNSILWCEPSPRIRRWKKARWRNGRGNSRKGRSRTICTNWLEIRLNIANLWRDCEGTQCLSSSFVTSRNRKV